MGMRNVMLEKIENFRDLGGYACDYGETSFGVIYRSATIAYASDADKAKIRSLGIKTIIDLREEKTKEALPCPFKGEEGITLLELPVNGNGRIATHYEDYVASYLEMLEDPASARRVLLSILHAEKPALIHCNAGKDRTGVFSMILLLAAGVAFDEVNADYMASFPLLSRMTKDTRENHPEVPELLLTPDIRFLRDVYDEFLRRYGSIDHYFEMMGLSDDEAFSLKNLLGKQEKSCGAVVFRDGKVLVEHMAQGHYSIPKGHVEDIDADEYATARRELKEETGLEVERFLPGFRKSITYSPEPGVSKCVTFFIAIAKPGELHLQKEEVQDAYFLSPADAYITLSHDSDRRLVGEASYFEDKNN